MQPPGRYSISNHYGLRPEREGLHLVLQLRRVESRNNLFHKDYFNEWNKVEQIRNNTLFLYIALFGAVDPEILTYDPSVLGILNVEYNQLFKIVDESKYNTFSIVIDGKEYSRMWKEPRS